MTSNNNDKKRIMVISDNPLLKSGVAIQTKYMIESLLETDEYNFVCLGSAVESRREQPFTAGDWGEDFIIYPVENYGGKDKVREVMYEYKPDALWFMTDPRQYEWLWQMENEVRRHCPMIYYHVWDNKPVPDFNKSYYDSNDCIVTISELTNEIVKEVTDKPAVEHIPHCVDQDVFRKKDEEEVETFAEKAFGDEIKDKFVLFWNNRNCRRKQSGSLLKWLSDYIEKTGNDDIMLVMHTDPRSKHGPDLYKATEKFGLEKNVKFSNQKVPAERLSDMYNLADVTVNVADAEGFGLATLESMACQTPIIATDTGGLSEQVEGYEKKVGVSIEPCSKAIIGTQKIPYIYEDRISSEDFCDALDELYNMSEEERQKLGENALEHVNKNYKMEDQMEKWKDVFDEITEKHSSWPNEQYESWKIEEL